MIISSFIPGQEIQVDIGEKIAVKKIYHCHSKTSDDLADTREVKSF